ncbi:polysaccharide biosynthesis tyrosine autokinase [Mesorhizobium sp. B283B1A]|uniref:GumC family protein n=1 Tax=Mesorhizobium TaxID=68287 RepID=UPI001CD160A1|nr:MULTISPECIES: polysaccharide biosynthesis tyrosine autokinase [Mesorhizobium]MCA0049713.1 polysaccharide biosynthesis tyrosine autokinase [Mesorhizobium sp. B283B1A]UQS66840.1 polysaccharide biosynthesis tyrosine autokinase [Mesorhizobium opportunistum]
MAATKPLERAGVRVSVLKTCRLVGSRTRLEDPVRSIRIGARSVSLVDENSVWNRLGPFLQESPEPLEERTFGARELYSLFRRRLLLIVAIVIAGTALAFIAAVELPKTYTARSMIVVETDDPNPLDTTQAQPNQQPDKSRMDTEADLIASRVFASLVVDRLDLIQDPDFNTYLPPAAAGGTSDSSGGVLSQAVGLIVWIPQRLFSLVAGSGPQDATSLPPKDVQQDRAISAYLANLSVDRSGESAAMTISFFNDDAATAAKIANATARLFVEWSRDNKRQDIKDAVGFLRQQSTELASRIAAIEGQIAKYATEHGVSSDPRDDLLRASIQQANEQLSTARGEYTQAQARLAQVRLAAKNGDTGAGVDPLLTSDFLTSLRNDEATAMRDRAQLAGNYGRNHPLVQEADAKVAAVRAMISQEMLRTIAVLENDVRVDEGRVNQLVKSLEASNEELRQRSLAEAKLRELNNNLATEQKLYDLVSGKLGSLDPFSEAVEPGVRTVSTAEIPTSPSFPKLRLMLAGGLAASLVLALILVLTLESMEVRIRDLRRASKLIRAPLLASIPRLPQKFLRPALPPLETLLSRPRSAFSDAFRSLYNACTRMNGGRSKHVVLVSSGLPQEGKTTTAMGLAMAAGMDGALTALIDLDLRTRSLHTAMELGSASRTLGDYLQGDCALAEIVQTLPDIPQLDVLAPSADDQTLPEFLNSGQLTKLLEAFRLEYDVVIIDAPPVLVVEDAIRIAASVDTIVVVAAFDSTTQEALSQVVERLRFAGGPSIGWVFNRVDPFQQARGALRKAYMRRQQIRRYFFADSP